MLTETAQWDKTKVIDSTDENVRKYVFEKGDAVAEAVLYKYPTYKERTVICCSTQSGCPVGCRFCGAGDHFVRSLTAEEISAQVDRCVSDTGTDPDRMGRLQIMFMSMGEPLLNLKALVPALRDLHAKYPGAALLISTSGPDVDYGPMVKISQEIPTIGLQFSLHESTDEARDLLIPFKKKLNLAQIADQGEAWINATMEGPPTLYTALALWRASSSTDRFRSIPVKDSNCSEKTSLPGNNPPSPFCADIYFNTAGSEKSISG